MDEKPSEEKTTLIRQGEDATTFRDMVAFAASVETRPLQKLLNDLPGLAQLSQTKFDLATQVLRRRFRKEGEAEQQQLEVYAGEIADTIGEAELSDKVRTVFSGKK